MSSDVISQNIMNESISVNNLNEQYLSDNEEIKDSNSGLIPSKVVHIRNLFPECTDNNIVKLAIPFGYIENLVFSKKTSQVLIEMRDLDDAIKMVNHYNSYPLYIHSRNLGVQFSKHTKLELKTENTYVSKAINQANLAVDEDISGVRSDSPRTVLRVYIESSVGFQMNNIILYKIFQPYGVVLRIIIYYKNDKYHAFIEYETPEQAHVAMTHLNDQNILSGSCTLKVDFSKSKGPLEIRQSSWKCRNYIENPITPKEELFLKKFQSSRSYGLGMKGVCSIGYPMFIQQNGSPSIITPMLANSNPLSELSCQLCMLAWELGYALTPQAALVTANFIANTSNEANNGQLHNKHMISEYHQQKSHTTSQMNGNSLMSHDNMQVGQHNNNTPTRNTNGSIKAFNYNRHIPPPFLDYSTISGAGNVNSRIFSGMSSWNVVLIVSNLNESKATPDALFTLFGVYGDVMRVKIMFNHKNAALVQFSHPAQTSIAMNYLNGAPLWGRVIKVSMSKHHEIQLPKGAEDESTTLTKDYSNSFLHRFRKPMSKNFNNIYPPCDVLHLSNIPKNISENAIKELIESKGYVIKASKFKLYEKRMALIQFMSLEKAIEALIDIHNVQLAEKTNLRVSFSKSGI